MATAVPHPPGFDEIRREELARMFAGLFPVRRIFQPIMLLIILVVVLLDGSAWRAALLVSAPLAAIVTTWIEARRFQRLGLGAYAPQRDYWGTPIILPVAISCTVGHDSSVLFAALPLMGARSRPWPAAGARAARALHVAARHLGTFTHLYSGRTASRV